MSAYFHDFGLYNINIDYLRYLHTFDSEVQFDEDGHYERKPFVGVMIIIEGYHYFIPLSSRKSKHATWDNVGTAHYLVYEKVDVEKLRDKDVFKAINDKEVLKILAVLDIKKMIPVSEGLFSKINFKEVEPKHYRRLLQKECEFCENIKDGILKKANTIYEEQISTGVIHDYYCSFSLLEDACDNYLK